jgi:general secretion pathway protein A
MQTQPQQTDSSTTPFSPVPAPEDPFDSLVGGQPSVVPFVGPRDFLHAYALRENPFADCVHPAFFFRTAGHASAVRNMQMAVDLNTSLGLVTGASGTGKTLVTQLLLTHFHEPKHRVALVLATPGLSKTGILREILAELDIALPVGVARVQDLLKILGNYIIELHQEGRRLVLLFDESHLLSADCLHVIRTITNVEIPEQKLTTCILFGESRLGQRLLHASFEALRNRIYLRSELGPLTADETAQYIKFRLMSAGRLAGLFTDGALAAMHEASGGIPRTLNKVAMLSLIEGADRDAGMIDEAIVRAAAERL